MRIELLIGAATMGLLAACTSGRNYAPVVYQSDPSARTIGRSGETYTAGRQETASEYRGDDRRYGNDAIQQVAFSAEEPRPVVYEGDGGADYAIERRTVETAFSPPVGYVRINPGDTVYGLARRHGVTPQSIIEANKLRAPYALSIGEFLRVPGRNEIAQVQDTRRAKPASAPRRTADRSHTVRRGDTLYSISRASGVAVEDIARANRIRAPYTLAVGQTLSIPGASTTFVSNTRTDNRSLETVAASSSSQPARVTNVSTASSSSSSAFDWPVRGPVIAEYGVQSSGRKNDGINISAPAGTPVRAAASGQVIYKGSELEGYGNLILIKHESGWVTAYAHTDSILVEKGDQVARGQVIGKVGQTGSVDRPQLHFELRRDLKAIDPRTVLASS